MATTRFVSKTGSDVNAGSSWSQAWLTITKVNSSTVAGDTVVFGTGIWRGTTLVPVSGTASDRTCYIDSAFFSATPTTYPSRRVAWIYGSDSLSSWSVYSGSVYQCSYAGSTSGSLWQGNQVLFCQASLAAVNSAGKWWTNGSTIYVWAYGNGDPDSYDMEYQRRNPSTLCNPSTYAGLDYFSLVGLGFKFGQNSLMQNETSGNNQVNYVMLSHCYLSCVAYEYSGNPSLFLTQSNQIYNQYNYGGRITACSLGYVYSWGTGSLPQTPNSAHGNCITLYSAWGWKIDSNIVFGQQSETPFYLKYGMMPDRGDSACELSYDTICYNTINTASGTTYGIRLFGAVSHIAIFGNTFSNSQFGISNGPSGLNGYGTEGYFTITNNTFYNCQTAVASFNQEGAATPYQWPQRHNIFKWNVVYRATGADVFGVDYPAYWDKIDSNLYYAAGGTNTWDGGSWAAWNTAGFDTHNSFQNTNPNFVNAASGDFSRTGTISDVMNLTYGGKTWTRYGAIQTALTTPHISASPGTLTYTAALGGSNPANQTISISNGGVGTLTWSVSSGASWLSVSPASGSQTGTVTASVNIAGLAAGTYNANITISATGADNTPLTVPVTLTITRPHIVVNPTSLSFAGTQGASNPASKTIALSNSGGGTMSWTTSSGASWLSVSPASGSNAATLTASVNLSGVVAGNYNTNITITATGADNTPLTVPVSLSVAAVDNTAPTFTNVSGNGLITSTSSVITWTTNEPATSQVRYGLTASYGQTTTLDPALVTSHSVTLSGLTADTVYHFQVVSSDASGNQGVSGDNTFRTPKASSNLALGKTITVSGTYSGYSSAVINDGVIAATGGTSTTWASDQSTAPHWIDINLGQTYSIRSVRIYWATNTASGKAMRSLQYTIQTWNGSAFNDLVTVNNPTTDLTTYPDTVYTYDSTGAPTGFSVTVAPPEDNPSITSTGFPTVSTSRIRIYQPGNMGPESYPAIMWVTEVEIYSEDTAPPTAP